MQKVQKTLQKYYLQDIIHYCNYFIHPDDSVIEVGCGNGYMIHKIAGKQKTGIDSNISKIETAKKEYPNISFHCMDSENIELKQTFDVIILANLIGNLKDIENTFRGIHKICHPQTRIIITYYNHLWEPFAKFLEFLRLKTPTTYQNWLSLRDIHNLLSLSGFDTYRSSRRMIFPFYIPFVSTLLNTYIAKLPIINSFAINYFSFARPIQTKDKNDLSVSIIIPARNESGNIENAIKRIPNFTPDMEIIFIEGNSTDDTWKKIQEIQKKYNSKTIKIAQQTGKGKANAVWKGFEIATKDILMILDADLTVQPEELPKFYSAIHLGYGEFIFGNRLTYPMEKQAMRFLNKLGNKFFSSAFSWILEQPIKDTLCGTKVIRRTDYYRLVKNKKYFGNFDPFGDFDLIFGAHKLNLKMIEIPIHYKERTYGETNISRFRHGFLLLNMCLFALKKVKFY